MAETKPHGSSANADHQMERRQTQRVQIAMPVVVRGKHGEKNFEEEATTISINAHGCMVMIAAELVRAQQISLVNAKTAEELPCTVVFIGRRSEGKTEVGFKFAEPSPLFWRIAFPPENWDPSERKRAAPPRPHTGPRR
ncbi:MAG: PilZ domain-containing protein [Candidatus Acidiferrales bacterium]